MDKIITLVFNLYIWKFPSAGTLHFFLYETSIKSFKEILRFIFILLSPFFPIFYFTFFCCHNYYSPYYNLLRVDLHYFGFS